MVVEALAGQYNLSFKRGLRLKGKVASGLIEEQKVHLLKPTTYMNLSGQAVFKTVQYYKIALGRVFIIVDDVYLKFGAMRLRPTGSAGGHNGLKSIQACLHTPDYPRLRMGVGPKEGDLPNGRESRLEEYVLANFTSLEQRELSQVVENGVSVIKCWLSQGVEPASQFAGDLSKTL